MKPGCGGETLVIAQGVSGGRRRVGRATTAASTINLRLSEEQYAGKAFAKRDFVDGDQEGMGLSQDEEFLGHNRCR
jgi:hypothetical protein